MTFCVSHEMAIRIILATLEIAANRHSRHIVPLLSVKMDFYLRVFVRVYSNSAETKLTRTRLGMVLQSSQSPSFSIQPLGIMKKNRCFPAPLSVDPKCPHTQVGKPFLKLKWRR